MKTHSNGPQARSQLIVRALSAGAPNGILACGALRFPCVVGRSGRRPDKREGDGADAKILVQFPRFGLKKLVEKYAQLEKG